MIMVDNWHYKKMPFENFRTENDSNQNLEMNGLV